ncbi:MAG TPA: hypothetical protein VJL58_07495, partial [Pyrinomonadaceae bacterium]|nr:hypothetical protein [Pyrinomonadaceae bacterium]
MEDFFTLVCSDSHREKYEAIMKTTRAGTILLLLVSLIALFVTAGAQTTSFTYQGSLTDAGSPANGSFQMQFKLFDALSGGTQIGSTIPDVPVTATNGVFKASLNFGSVPLSGANRWLEIAVRHNSGESYTTLSPREQIASSPYSVRTLSAAMADDSQKLGGVAASEYVTTSNGGNSFIKNSVTGQTNANYNIDGNGQVGGNLAVGGTNNSIGKIQVINLTNPKDTAIFAVNNISGNAALATRGTSFFSGGTPPFTPSAALSGEGVHVGSITGGGYVFARNYPANTTAPLFLNHLGGNVGIGMTAPTHALDVNGFFRASHPAGGNVVSETTGGVNSWAKLWMRTPVQSWSIGSSNTFNGNQLYFANENQGLIRMAIMPDGKVGIGTTAPNAALHVEQGFGTAAIYGKHNLVTAIRGESGSNSGVEGISATGSGVFAHGTANGSVALIAVGDGNTGSNNTAVFGAPNIGPNLSHI